MDAERGRGRVVSVGRSLSSVGLSVVLARRVARGGDAIRFGDVADNEYGDGEAEVEIRE